MRRTFGRSVSSGGRIELFVERAQSANGTFTQLVSVPSNSSSFVDGAVSRKTTYYYRVKASNANGTSSYSNVVSAYVK